MWEYFGPAVTTLLVIIVGGTALLELILNHDQGHMMPDGPLKQSIYNKSVCLSLRSLYYV